MVPPSAQPQQHLLLSVLFILAIVVSVKWYLVALICISLMINGADRLLICLFVICTSSLENVLSNPLPTPQLIYCLLLLDCRCFYIFWVQVPYHIYQYDLTFFNIPCLGVFSCCVLFFTFLTVSFETQMFLILMNSNVSIFSLDTCAFLVLYVKRLCLT